MNIHEHPVLRFFRTLVPDLPQPCFSETEFLEQQLAVLEAYVERFPADERDLRALAWIEANAERYRQQWQRQATANGHHGLFAGWTSRAVTRAMRFLHTSRITLH